VPPSAAALAPGGPRPSRVTICTTRRSRPSRTARCRPRTTSIRSTLSVVKVGEVVRAAGWFTAHAVHQYLHVVALGASQEQRRLRAEAAALHHLRAGHLPERVAHRADACARRSAPRSTVTLTPSESALRDTAWRSLRSRAAPSCRAIAARRRRRGRQAWRLAISDLMAVSPWERSRGTPNRAGAAGRAHGARAWLGWERAASVSVSSRRLRTAGTARHSARRSSSATWSRRWHEARDRDTIASSGDRSGGPRNIVEDVARPASSTISLTSCPRQHDQRLVPRHQRNRGRRGCGRPDAAGRAPRRRIRPASRRPGARRALAEQRQPGDVRQPVGAEREPGMPRLGAALQRRRWSAPGRAPPGPARAPPPPPRWVDPAAHARHARRCRGVVARLGAADQAVAGAEREHQSVMTGLSETRRRAARPDARCRPRRPRRDAAVRPPVWSTRRALRRALRRGAPRDGWSRQRIAHLRGTRDGRTWAGVQRPKSPHFPPRGSVWRERKGLLASALARLPGFPVAL